MSVVVTYNPDDNLVANRVLDFNPSANAPDYDGIADKLIDPDLSALWVYGSGFIVPLQYWKYDGVSTIVEMSQAEKDNLNTNLNTYHVFADGYHVTRKTYQTLVDIQKFYKTGDHKTEISFTACGSKNNKSGFARITIGSYVAETQIFLKEKNYFVPFLLKNRQSLLSDGNQNIKIEVKASHGVALTVHDIIVEID